MTPDFGSLSSVQDLSPRTRLPNSSDHFVELYDDDRYLNESLSRFVSVGLAQGDAAIVIARPAHREALNQALADQGVDVRAAGKDGLLTTLDAADTLAVFMEDGAPNPKLFRDLFATVIEGASAGRRVVRVFGEMVAVLWSWGNVAGALRLEDLWNELAESHPLRLFCAYPAESFGERNVSPLRSVCHRHTHVIAAPNMTI
jgi:MEDS: MEthanogen/methylotroph, DcmR Sensory domain